MSKYIKLNDAAAEIGVSRWTLRRWCRNGYRGCPPCVKQGSKESNVLLINRVEWEAFLIKLERELAIEQAKQQARQQVAA